MCPYLGRRYYDWMLRVNQGFAEIVESNKKLVLEQLVSDLSLRQLTVALSIVDDADELAVFLDKVPFAQQKELKQRIAGVVRADGDVHFDWETNDEDDHWEVKWVALPPDGVHGVGMIIILFGPFERVGSVQAASS